MANVDWNQIWIFIGGWSLIGAALTWIIFAFTTMRKLDKAVVAEGMPRPCQWDPVCGRAIWYTWPIIFSGKSFSELENRIIDTQIVKKNINLFDKILALVLFLSIWTMVASVIVGWIFDFYQHTYFLIYNVCLSITKFDFFIAVAPLIIAMPSWFVFAITTMRKIDKAVIKKGNPRPCQWDPMFIRALLYAWPTALPEKIFNDLDDRIISTAVVKSVVNIFDKTVALLILIATSNLIFFFIIDWLLGFFST